MPTTWHPLIFAIWPTIEPTEPAAAETTTVSPSFGSGIVPSDSLKCSGPSFPDGFSTSRTWRLTVAFMAFSPLDVILVWRFPVQLTAHQARNCTHCALH